MSGAPDAFWAYFLDQRVEIARLSLQHMGMVALALALGALVGMPAGVYIRSRPRAASWVLGAAAVVQTVPSVALLGMLMLLPLVGGIGPRPAVAALFLYSLMAIIENTCAGLRSVDPAVVDAARGLGMTEGQILLRIELPQASPVIVAGLRISAVLCVATATVASYVGAGGLGDLIFRGVGRGNGAMVAWGAVPAVVMSLTAHGILGWIERRLTRHVKPR